jgi:hypothetical protein
MPALDHIAGQAELSYNHASPFQFELLPSILAYAVGLTSDFSIHTHPRCAHARPKPSLKMRLICLAGIFGLVGTTIHQPTSVDTYFSTELPIAKAGLLANIGSDGVKSSGAKVCVGIAQDTART